jgi:2-keto-3-deoxy-6-phosphogluconate aldolase
MMQQLWLSISLQKKWNRILTGTTLCVTPEMFQDSACLDLIEHQHIFYHPGRMTVSEIHLLFFERSVFQK